MIIVTNLPAISEAFDGAAPRSVDEVMLEHYPDATVDRWGRAHAPHDGYSDPDGNVYRGGEYLPEPPEFDEMKQLQRMMNGRRRPALKVYHDGRSMFLKAHPGRSRQRARSPRHKWSILISPATLSAPRNGATFSI
jgi:hypothetical protein